MDIQEEREAFEEWYCRNHTGLKQSDLAKFRTLSGYSFSDSLKIDVSWEAWQAAKDESHKQAALYQSEINHLAQANQQWREKAAQAIPEGFVAVPKEPTKKMRVDGAVAWCRNEGVHDIYKAMIEAAQEPTND